MRLDALLFDHPGQHRGSAISGIANEALWREVELRLYTLDHRPGRINFGGTVRRGSFHIHDHAVLSVDQVIRGVGKVSRAAWRCCPTGLRIGERNFLGKSFSQRLFIKGFEVLAHGAAAERWITPIDFISRRPTLPAGIRLDDAGVDGETFTLDQAGRHAAPQHLIEQPAEQIAVTETAVAILREGRVIGYFVFQTQPAEPAIGQV
ncbi:hypothetical protein D3C78_1101300 [compost metagenome]